MSIVRFLQVSDFHLGRPFGGLPAERRAERKFDLRRALELSVRTAIERGVDAILIPGDLFDLECVDADTLAFTVHAFAVAGCPPVFIAPGNHDPASDTSHYWNPQLLKARGWAWPDHVHVFRSPAWTMMPLPGHPDVRIWGRCFVGGVASADRPLSSAALADVARPGEGIDVALFHGSREGFVPPGQKITAPFDDDEIARAPFEYMAVGHYHTPQRVDAKDGTGRPRLAYAGAAIGLDVSEVGAHGALEVTIAHDSQPAATSLEFVELDRRRVLDLAVDVTGATSAEQIDRRATKALDQAGAGEGDIATVRLAGRLSRGVRYAGPGPELRARAFFVRTDLRRMRPDYDLDAYRRDESGTTEARFARALLERIDGDPQGEDKAVLESALYYGLDAFRLGEVVPAYEEIAE